MNTLHSYRGALGSAADLLQRPVTSKTKRKQIGHNHIEDDYSDNCLDNNSSSANMGGNNHRKILIETKKYITKAETALIKQR